LLLRGLWPRDLRFTDRRDLARKLRTAEQHMASEQFLRRKDAAAYLLGKCGFGAAHTLVSRPASEKAAQRVGMMDADESTSDEGSAS